MSCSCLSGALLVQRLFKELLIFVQLPLKEFRSPHSRSCRASCSLILVQRSLHCEVADWRGWGSSAGAREGVAAHRVALVEPVFEDVVLVQGLLFLVQLFSAQRPLHREVAVQGFGVPRQVPVEEVPLFLHADLE